jgi:hypothetical protein
MSNFLEGYEDVNARIIRARAEYPTLRLVAYIEDIDITKGYILVKAEAYKEYEDHLPSAVDYAFEMRSDRGVNLHFWVENAVTSAYGRVIGLLTPGGIARSTKQDMEKVEALSAKDVAPASADLWATTPTIASAIEAVKNELGGIYLQGKPECQHGARVWKTGTSAKTGREWGNYSCTEKSKATQCEPVWYMQTSTGWAPQV